MDTYTRVWMIWVCSGVVLTAYCVYSCVSAFRGNKVEEEVKYLLASLVLGGGTVALLFTPPQ
jgi:hypothetical protein